MPLPIFMIEVIDNSRCTKIIFNLNMKEMPFGAQFDYSYIPYLFRSCFPKVKSISTWNIIADTILSFSHSSTHSYMTKHARTQKVLSEGVHHLQLFFFCFFS